MPVWLNIGKDVLQTLAAVVAAGAIVFALEVIAQPWIGPRIWRQRSLARGCAMTS